MVLVRQRCLIHADREAAARCGRCGRFFCRECVTEHDGAMTCAACLRELAAAAARSGPPKPRFWRGAWATGTARTGKLLASALLAWLFFHLLGHSLLNAPDEFHAGTLWEKVTGQPDTDDGD